MTCDETIACVVSKSFSMMDFISCNPFSMIGEAGKYETFRRRSSQTSFHINFDLSSSSFEISSSTSLGTLQSAKT